MKIQFALFIVATALLSCGLAKKELPELEPYLTTHFVNWLDANGYGEFEFARTDIDGGSYGGKSDENDCVTNQPVIFIHGASGKAIGTDTDPFNGFTESIQYFLSKGYKQSELYATTWGNANATNGPFEYHSYAYLNYLRKFVEAVIAYTGADKVDIISNSMGVTLGRKVVKGGAGFDGVAYDLGASLSHKVDTFVGIAGLNWGFENCTAASFLPFCSPQNGFYPGTAAGPVGLSAFLDDINTSPGREGSYVFSMLSLADDFVGNGDQVYGRLTGKIPRADGHKIYKKLTHTEIKTKAAEQLKMITKHQV